MINISLKIRGMREILVELSDAATKAQLAKANDMAGTALVNFMGRWYDVKERDGRRASFTD